MTAEATYLWIAPIAVVCGNLLSYFLALVFKAETGCPAYFKK